METDIAAGPSEWHYYALLLWTEEPDSVDKFLENLKEKHPFTITDENCLEGCYRLQIETQVPIIWNEITSEQSHFGGHLQAGFCEMPKKFANRMQML